LAPGTAARIFTGAPIPAGADAVIIQEDCTAGEGTVIINRRPATGDNIRVRGDDIAAGQAVLAAGTRLKPQDLGVAASVGAAQLSVFRRLKVATLFTGDELALPGTALKPGQIYNSNRDTVRGLLASLGCEVVDLGIVEDTLPATLSALNRAAAEADVVISSGGVSVGEEDHIKSAVLQLGKLDLWRLAIRPGKPLAFGHIGATDFVGLPGNPVSVFATFCLFVRPFLLKRMGSARLAPRTLMVRADFDRPRPLKVREFLRVQLVTGEDGLTWAREYRTQSSGVLTSVSWADGLAVAPENETFQRGTWLRFYPMSELVD
jgi:molybdopterin molybdotransferase